ncbi:hypothetical protein TKK_0002908 [Trichogramma kaykai]
MSHYQDNMMIWCGVVQFMNDKSLSVVPNNWILKTYDVALIKLKIREDYSDVEDRYQLQQAKASRHDGHLKKLSTDNDSDGDNLQRQEHPQLLKDFDPPSLPLEFQNDAEKRTSLCSNVSLSEDSGQSNSNYVPMEEEDSDNENHSSYIKVTEKVNKKQGGSLKKTPLKEKTDSNVIGGHFPGCLNVAATFLPRNMESSMVPKTRLPQRCGNFPCYQGMALVS